MAIKHLDKKIVFPKDLGLDLPEVVAIGVGQCVAPKDKIHGVDAWGIIDGHTHGCEDDENYGIICLSPRMKIFNKLGGMSNVMYHEYAHVLAPTRLGCEENLAFVQRYGIDEWVKYCHGPVWQNRLARMGKSNIATPYSIPDDDFNTDYITFYAWQDFNPYSPYKGNFKPASYNGDYTKLTS